MVHSLGRHYPAEPVVAVLNHIAQQLDDHVLHGETGISSFLVLYEQMRDLVGGDFDFTESREPAKFGRSSGFTETGRGHALDENPWIR